MYDAETFTVELLCENSLMKAIVDRFSAIRWIPKRWTAPISRRRLRSRQAHIYAWIFTYAGKIKILSPNSCEAYKAHLTEAAQNA